ncbi:5,10-methylenetetrahydromethanopterin reductase [Halobacterium yunchengense]|uniref:5,10-methylenetetrahydromethanopterin reductase n=1 Tax=Halobacterium yunchengense TaxID=3108497 RepID=UPI00300A2266
MRGVELTPEVPVEEVASLAADAEAAGFDAVFASCHYNNRDPFVALDRVAAATSEVSLGPGVANPYDTHPVKLASQVGTLDEVSGGRAVLGLGAGDASTLRNLGVDRDRPLRRVLEAMKVAQGLWDGERVDHDGTFVARDAGLNYDVGDVPVYVGAQGPHMLRMAGKHADGVLVNASHERDLSWAADRVAEGVEDRVVDGDVDVAAFASVSVAEDAAAAREAARPPVAFIAAGAAPPVLDRHGIDRDIAAEIGERIEAGEFSAAFDAVSDRMLDAFCVAGDPGDVAERLAAVGEHVDSVVAASPLGPDRAAAVGLLADAFDRAGV